MNFCTKYCLLVRKYCQQTGINVCRNRYNTISVLTAKRRLLILEVRVRCEDSQCWVSNTQSRTGNGSFWYWCLYRPVAIPPTRPTQISSPPTLLIISLGLYLICVVLMVWHLTGHSNEICCSFTGICYIIFILLTF